MAGQPDVVAKHAKAEQSLIGKSLVKLIFDHKDLRLDQSSQFKQFITTTMAESRMHTEKTYPVMQPLLKLFHAKANPMELLEQLAMLLGNPIVSFHLSNLFL